MRIILGSNSPRRKELIEKLEIDYIVAPADVDEHIDADSFEILVKELSRLKADATAEKFKKNPDYSDCAVLGADTVVAVNGKVLGKPKDKEDAFRMLKLLSGNIHYVCTGVTIIPLWDESKTITFFETAKVSFISMSDNEIADYVNSGEPMDKAGAYGIQGLGGRFIDRIEGDYYTIMGLPLCRVYQELKKISE